MRSIALLFFCTLFSNIAFGQTCGCTDKQAKNFDSKAELNDGSCLYSKIKAKPLSSVSLNNELKETSGLLHWNHQLWTINDDSDTHIYSIDALGNPLEKTNLKKVQNKDWEGLTQDSLHIYIGDFGNNVSGNRKDLHILKIKKNSLLKNQPVVDSLFFSFENQINFDIQKPNSTNFDCETILATKDSLYVLTKEWTSLNTRLFALPKTAGVHVAKYKGTLDVNGLITGGVIIEEAKTIVLCGYSKKLQPFLYLLYDYKNTAFFSGNKRKIRLALPFHQIEGIAHKEGAEFYLTNENFQRKPFISVQQQLHLFDLGPYFDLYLSKYQN